MANKILRQMAPRVIVDVPGEIIATAIRNSSGHCMISASIQVAIPDASYISTDLQTIRWTNLKKRERYVYLTPPVAQQALIKFDRGDEDILPFRFRLYQGQTTSMRSEKPRGRRALVRAEGSSDANQLQATGGKPPPLSALAWGSGAGRKSLVGPLSAGYLGKQDARAEADARVGRRRRFGLGALRE